MPDLGQKDSREKEKEKKGKLAACRAGGSAAGPLLAARALPLRCAASTMLTICTGYCVDISWLSPLINTLCVAMLSLYPLPSPPLLRFNLAPVVTCCSKSSDLM
jgi:hypothetical protein